VEVVEPTPFHYYKPLADAASGYVEWASSPEKRVYLGLEDFDRAMRGIGPSQLCLIVGFAHSGKTVVVTEIVLNNRHRRIAWFTPDETRESVLVKLVCAKDNTSAEWLEQRILRGDEDATAQVRDAAEEDFPTLAVFDESLSLAEMDEALEECTAVWSDQPELVIFDYLDLLEGEDTQHKVRDLKAWGKRWNVPLIVLHQSSRSKGADGQRGTITSGAFGGEQEAIHMLVVRRKRDQYRALIADLEDRIAQQAHPSERIYEQLADARASLERHRDTLTLSLVKNKVPPSRLVDDVDFGLDQLTGRITALARERWHEPEFDI
jgi:replicative DNA helicase